MDTTVHRTSQRGSAMAKQVLLLDDLTGEVGAQSARFSLMDRDYECELGDNTLLELEAALERFIEVARDVSPPRYNRIRESVDQGRSRLGFRSGTQRLPQGPRPRLDHRPVHRRSARGS